MKYKIFLGLIISACLITVMVFTNTDSSPENINQPKEQVLLKSRGNDNSLERTTKTQVIDKTNEPEVAASKVSKKQKPQKESLFGKVTPDEFSQQFVFTDKNKEFVAKSALDKIFRMDTDALF